MADANAEETDVQPVITLSDMREQVKRLESLLRDELSAIREETATCISLSRKELKETINTSNQRFREELLEMLVKHGGRHHATGATDSVPNAADLVPDAKVSQDSTNGKAKHIADHDFKPDARSHMPIDAGFLNSMKMSMRHQNFKFRVGQYNILAGYLGNNTEPWFLSGVEMPNERRAQITRLHSERLPDGKPANPGWPKYVQGVLSEVEQAEVERLSHEHFAWDQRKDRLLDVIRNMHSDILSLVECDHYEDHFKPGLETMGYESLWQKRPRRRSFDGCCIAWRPAIFEFVASTHIEYVDRYDYVKKQNVKDRIALIVLLRAHMTGDLVCFVSTHLARNPEDVALDRLRTRQVGQMVRLLGDFVREHHALNASVIVAGDLNIGCFRRLRGMAMSVALLREDTLVHPFMFDCTDVPTSVTSVTSARNVRIDALLYQTRRLELIDRCKMPDLRTDDPIPNKEHPSDHVPISATYRVRNQLHTEKKTACAWYLRLAGRDCSLPLNQDQLRDAFKFYDQDGRGRISKREFREAIDELLGHGVSSQAEVQQVLAIFPPEGLDFTAFVQAYRTAIATEGMPGMDDFVEAFRSFDKDSSGTIEVGEVLQLFNECCPAEVPEAELHKIFTSIDASGDGHIDIAEFCSYIGEVWSSKFIHERDSQ